MKKNLLVFLLVCASAIAAKAAPGDTTWVQVFTGDSLTHYGNFDKPAAFPSGSTTYRKVYMIFTMGEYACPAGSQYCHQWDYTVLNYLMTSTGDTFEISRFISPFATSGTPRFPSTWSHRYIFDVTDYYPLLKGNQAMRILYSGYSWGFTANVKFAFVEGTPERNVLQIDRLWHGSWDYGNASNPISNHLPTMTKTAPSNVQSSELKFRVTGHGSDATQQCCEFASHGYTVSANGAQVDQKTIWRDNCGLNELYPQGGTWIFDRGGWCPGATVLTNSHILTGVAAGSYTAGVNFDAYTNTPNSSATGYGSYTIESAVVHYGAMNHALDASLEEIIAPTNYEGHYRPNPAGSKPTVHVRNSGSSAITSITFAYNVKDSSVAQYTWSGNLAARQETDIELPVLEAITNLSLSSATGLYNFMVRIASVNGQADNDATNDTLRSQFVVAPTWPKTFAITMKTNSEGVTGIGQNPSETSWAITDMANNIIYQRSNANVSTTYVDTITIVHRGFYKLTIKDGGCDGLHWWVWDQNPGQGITAGSFVVSKVGAVGTIPMNNYTYGNGSYHDDFGCSYSQYFTTTGYPAGIENVNSDQVGIDAYPNPAHGTVHIAISGLNQVNGDLQLLDATGRVVKTEKCNDAQHTMNVSGLANGVYMVIFNGEGETGLKLQTRLVITQ